jgi:hypothetical protein
MADHADFILPDTLPGPDRPLSIGGLVSDAADILRDATDLPRPRSVTVYDTSQHISMQFSPDPGSYAALACWAELFGGTITSQPWQAEDGQPVNICRVQFEYYGIAVEAFAVIPAVTATT